MSVEIGPGDLSYVAARLQKARAWLVIEVRGQGEQDALAQGIGWDFGEWSVAFGLVASPEEQRRAALIGAGARSVPRDRQS